MPASGHQEHLEGKWMQVTNALVIVLTSVCTSLWGEERPHKSTSKQHLRSTCKYSFSDVQAGERTVLVECSGEERKALTEQAGGDSAL